MDRKLLVRNKICNSKLDFVSGRFVYQCCFTRHNKDAGLEQEKESCKGSMEGTSAPRCNDGSIEGSMYEGITVCKNGVMVIKLELLRKDNREVGDRRTLRKKSIKSCIQKSMS